MRRKAAQGLALRMRHRLFDRLDLSHGNNRSQRARRLLKRLGRSSPITAKPFGPKPYGGVRDDRASEVRGLGAGRGRPRDFALQA